MSVNPGFGGQKFIPSVLNKVTAVRAMLDRIQSAALLEVDGGIKVDNASRVVAAGATVLVAGSAVFSSRDYAVTIAALRATGQPASVHR
jgi:ribulose-phosphate 3-epimerase